MENGTAASDIDFIINKMQSKFHNTLTNGFGAERKHGGNYYGNDSTAQYVSNER